MAAGRRSTTFSKPQPSILPAGARPFVASGFKPLPIKNWQSGNATTTGSWFQPLWKIWKSVGIIIPNIYGKMKNVPNHQPETILSGYGSQCCHKRKKCWYMLVKNSSGATSVSYTIAVNWELVLLVQLWPFTSYNWLFLCDYTFYKWGFVSTYNW